MAPNSAAIARTTDLLPAALARRLDRLTLVTRSRLLASGQGDRRSRRRGTSLEFVDYRPYSPGDDPARLDWNVFARSGQLQVKLFEAEELLGVEILLDGSASMGWGRPDKFDRARQIAAALGYLGLAEGNRVHVSGLGRVRADRSRPLWGRHQAPELLGYLANLLPDAPARAAQDDGGLARLVGESQRPESGRSVRHGTQLVILVSDLLSATWQEALRALGQPASELVVLHVLDAEELNPPLSGDLNLLDQETASRLPVTLNAEVAAWYQARVQAWLAEVGEFCARRGFRYARHITSDSLERWLFRDLRQRGILR